MDPVRGEAEDDIAGLDAARQVLAPLHRADGEARKVEVAPVIHARHLGGLAPDQGAAAVGAALGDAGDDAGGLVKLQLAGGEIVQEEQRLGPLADQVVDAHGDEVDADRVHMAGVDGDAQLGAHPVGRGDKDRVGVARGLEVEKRAKTAEAAHGAGAVGGLGRRLDPVDKRVAGVDVHARIRVGQPLLLVRHPDPLSPLSSPVRYTKTGSAATVAVPEAHAGPDPGPEAPALA